MIYLSTGEVPAPPETRNNILFESDILIYSDGKIWMQYIVSDTNPNIGDGTRGNMGVTLNASNKGGGCGPRIPW